MARAHESHSYLVQANVGATISDSRLDAQGGSHGNSLVIAPDGNLLIKAPVFGEFIVLRDLDLRKTSGVPGYQPHGFMTPFYAAGQQLLRSMPID
jgi:predicted amidohydrolase